MARLGSHLDIGDPRGDGRFLRLSWHQNRRVIVVSQWREGVCISSTPVGIEHLAKLVGFLVGALQEAVSLPVVPAATRPPSRLAQLRALLGPRPRGKAAESPDLTAAVAEEQRVSGW